MGIFAMIRKAFESASKRVPTGELNRFVAALKGQHEVKVKYISQVDVRPPKFLVSTDKTGGLHFSAERHLINRGRIGPAVEMHRRIHVCAGMVAERDR